MNELTPEQKARILERLRAGRSLRAIQTETGHRRETIARYGRREGLLPPTPLRTNGRRDRDGGGLQGSVRRPRIASPQRSRRAGTFVRA